MDPQTDLTAFAIVIRVFWILTAAAWVFFALVNVNKSRQDDPTRLVLLPSGIKLFRHTGGNWNSVYSDQYRMIKTGKGNETRATYREPYGIADIVIHVVFALVLSFWALLADIFGDQPENTLFYYWTRVGFVLVLIIVAALVSLIGLLTGRAYRRGQERNHEGRPPFKVRLTLMRLLYFAVWGIAIITLFGVFYLTGFMRQTFEVHTAPCSQLKSVYFDALSDFNQTHSDTDRGRKKNALIELTNRDCVGDDAPVAQMQVRTMRLANGNVDRRHVRLTFNRLNNGAGDYPKAPSTFTVSSNDGAGSMAKTFWDVTPKKNSSGDYVLPSTVWPVSEGVTSIRFTLTVEDPYGDSSKSDVFKTPVHKMNG